MKVTTAFAYVAMPLEQKIDVMVSVRTKMCETSTPGVSFASYGGINADKTNIDMFFHAEPGVVDEALEVLAQMHMNVEQMRREKVSTSPLLSDEISDSNAVKKMAEVVYLVKPLKRGI